MSKLKYPRTLHLPDSPGVSSDDKVLQDLSLLEDKMWVVTEKMDGENTTMMSDCIYARSLDSNNHPSRNWVKGLWGKIQHEIPKDWRICGENMYAKHSIQYNNLKSYFLVFSIWDELNKCLSWKDTVDYCNLLDLSTVPVWYYGFNYKKGIPSNLDICTTEGYVIRRAGSFKYEDFQKNVFKWVRSNHVQTDKHWSTNQVIKNNLCG